MRGFFKRRAGRIDGRDVPLGIRNARATGQLHARQRRHREATGVAITIQHVLESQAARVVRKFAAAVTLVQIKAGFVAFGDVERQLPAVLVQHQLDLARSAQPAFELWQALQGAAAGVGTFIQFAQSGGGQQSVGQHVLPALGASRQKLRHQGVAITVHDQPRQTVGFAMHQAHGVTWDVKSGSSPYGTCANSY